MRHSIRDYFMGSRIVSRRSSWAACALLVLVGNRCLNRSDEQDRFRWRAAGGEVKWLKQPRREKLEQHAASGESSPEGRKQQLRAESAARYAQTALNMALPTVQRVEAGLRSARCRMTNRNWEQAARVLERTLELCPKNGSARLRVELERAHLLRRQEQHEQALMAYEAIAESIYAAPTERDTALWWAARESEDSGDRERATRRYRRIAQQALDPFARIRAYDRLARIYIDANDLEAAAGVLHACAMSINAEMAAATPTLSQLRERLKSMTSHDRLRRAIAKRFEQSSPLSINEGE
ncbi:MAG: tetratricopeptide (TPR) repeat protein [Planctomycetota bacterium]|jgi:tetratricopeptide (TPR) repeat protein